MDNENMAICKERLRTGRDGLVEENNRRTSHVKNLPLSRLLQEKEEKRAVCTSNP